MTEKQFTAPLGMVTTPYDAIKVARGPRFRLDRYTLLRAIHQLGVLVLMTVLCVATYLLISNYFIKSVKVVGTSMSPTLQEGGQYLLDRFSLLSREPRRNEIVVIRDPGTHGGLAVKRVIAVAGESVFFKDGSVYVNGKKLDEPYLLPRTMTFTYASANEQFITCGKDQ
ncbi:MAG TPA: signal peptidase I, partial [Verrucomicrobiae bacterium]|nr:signal peptidase I [Verrucomicrobiae bacterium]